MRAPVWLAVLLLALSGCATNPVTGKAELDLLGEEQELALGAQFYQPFIQDSLGPIEDAPLSQLVEKVGTQVAAVSHRPRLPYQFTAVNDPAVNAFALPGGKICITRGLLVRLESEDGLAAVLGHEVGHVTARHAVAAYNRQVLATLFLATSAAVLEAKEVKGRELIWVGGLIGTQMLLARYSREQERESDTLGLQYAVAAGFSPRGMVETQRILLALGKEKPNLVERLFATHPHSAERLATAERLLAQLSPEVQNRPVRKEGLLQATASLRQVQPAWEEAAEGRALLAQDEVGKALTRLARARDLAPKEGVIRTLLALALWENKKKSEALEEAFAGAKLAPRVFLSRLVAGIVSVDIDPLASLGELAAAEEILPETAPVPFFQGQAYEKLGQRQKAVEAYREALRRDPEGKVGQEAASRLRALGVR
ncbi:MAG: M48 family metalloprotease [Acidobacteriota bacterium]